MPNPDDWVTSDIALKITRSLRRARYHRLEGNDTEAEAAETSLNGWLDQWARITAAAKAKEPA